MSEIKIDTPKKEQLSTPKTNIWVVNVSNRQEPLKFVSESLAIGDSQLSLVKQSDFCDTFIKKSEELLERSLQRKVEQSQYSWHRFLIARGILRDGTNIIEEGETITLNPVLIDHYGGKLSYLGEGFARGVDEAKKLIRTTTVVEEKGEKLQKEFEDRLSLGSDVLPQHIASLTFVFV